MPFIVALEPNRTQASRLSSVVNGLDADLSLVTSIEGVLKALNDRVPDLILIPALLSLTDETSLTDRLRELGPAASHVQTLTIPILASATPARTRSRGVLKSLRRGKPRTAVPDGCDPAVFGGQISEYLARAADARLAAEAAARQATETAERRAAEAAARAAEEGDVEHRNTFPDSSDYPLALPAHIEPRYAEFDEARVAVLETRLISSPSISPFDDDHQPAQFAEQLNPATDSTTTFDEPRAVLEHPATYEAPSPFGQPLAQDEAFAVPVEAPRSVLLSDEALPSGRPDERSVVLEPARTWNQQPATLGERLVPGEEAFAAPSEVLRSVRLPEETFREAVERSAVLEQSLTFAEQPEYQLYPPQESLDPAEHSLLIPEDAAAIAEQDIALAGAQVEPEPHFTIEVRPAAFDEHLAAQIPPIDTLDAQQAVRLEIDALKFAGQDATLPDHSAEFLKEPSLDETLEALEGPLRACADRFDAEALAVDAVPFVDDRVAFVEQPIGSQAAEDAQPMMLEEPLIFDMPSIAVEESWVEPQQIEAPEPTVIPAYEIAVDVPHYAAPSEAVMEPVPRPPDPAGWWIAVPISDQVAPVPVQPPVDAVSELPGALTAALEVVIPANSETVPNERTAVPALEDPRRTRRRRSRHAANRPRKSPVPLEVVFDPPEIITVYEDVCSTVVMPRPPATAAREVAVAGPVSSTVDTTRRKGDTSRRKGDTTRRKGDTTRRQRNVPPPQDEWGLFDPAKCGFSALLDKLDEVTEPEKTEQPAESVRSRVVSY